MSQSSSKRCMPFPTITIALETIPIQSHDHSEWANVPIEDIQIVRPSEGGLLDIVYTSVRRLPSGITVHEIKSGETTIDQLLIALGWQAGMPHNEHLAKLTDYRFET